MGLMAQPGRMDRARTTHGDVDGRGPAGEDGLVELLRTLAQLGHHDQIPDGLVGVLDPLGVAYLRLRDDGRIRSWNRSARPLLRAGTCLDAVLAPHDVARVLRTKDHGGPTRLSRLRLVAHGLVDAYVLADAAGGERHVFLVGGPPSTRSQDDAGDPASSVRTALLELALDRLEDVQTLASSRETAVEVFAHDLRSPLLMVASLLESLADGERPKEEQAERRLLREVVAAVRSTLSVVDGVTSFVGIEHERPGPSNTRADVDLGLIAARVVEAVGRGEVRVTVASEDTVVHGDGCLLERAITNLVSNAVSHGRGQSVDVSVRSEDGHVTVCVEDRGPGVPNDLKSMVFEPFCRGHAADRGGLGLGLALVERIAHLHGGEVAVADRIGGGASFRLAVPRDRQRTNRNGAPVRRSETPPTRLTAPRT